MVQPGRTHHGEREGRAMGYHVKYSTLLGWFAANAVVTLCFGIYLGVACLYPPCAPYIRALVFDARVDMIIPYIIFALMIGSLASMMYYYDLYRDGN
jgi:hypothetical protein